MREKFISRTKDGFDWAGFQAYMGYTDEQLARIQSDPKRSAFVQSVCSEAFQNKYLVCEIVAIEGGCVAGLEPGDRIVYRGLDTLVPELSTAWCPYIQNTFWYANNARVFLNNGLDPNVSYVPFSGCMDVGPENGLGRAIYKTYVLDKSELGQLKRRKRATLRKIRRV